MYSQISGDLASGGHKVSRWGLFNSSGGRAGLAGGGVILAILFTLGRGWFNARSFEDEAVPDIKRAISVRYNDRGLKACPHAACRRDFLLLQSNEVQVALHDTPSLLRLGIPWFHVDVPFYYLVKDKDGEGIAEMAPPESEERRRKHRIRRRARDWRVISLQLDGESD